MRRWKIFSSNQGFEVTKPLFDGDEVEVRQDYQENLRLCDAVLIYYGQANEAWLRGKLRDLQKIAGYGRETPMRARAIYVAGPQNPQKAAFRTHEMVVIKNFAGFSPDDLAPFLKQLEARSEGRS